MHRYPIPIAFRVGLGCFLHYYLDKSADKKIRIRIRSNFKEMMTINVLTDHENVITDNGDSSGGGDSGGGDGGEGGGARKEGKNGEIVKTRALPLNNWDLFRLQCVLMIDFDGEQADVSRNQYLLNMNVSAPLRVFISMTE